MQTRVRIIFFTALLLAVIGVTFLIFSPYLITLLLAAAFAVVVQPFYKWTLIAVRGYRGIAAAITILFTAVLIIAPLSLVITQVVGESAALYARLSANPDTLPWDFLSTIETTIEGYLPQVDLNLNQYIGQGARLLASQLGTIFTSTITTGLHILLGIIAFYYFLRDGNRFVETAISLSPLSDRDDNQILTRLDSAINSILKGTVFIALLQSISTGIGLAIFGVPSAVLWGAIAAVGALIPTLGTAIVIVPAVLYLYLTGNTFGAVGLTIWGLVAVGLIDNLLGPILVGKGIRIHPLFILFSVLGGLSLFGPVGFILGPLTLSLLVALLDIYKHLLKTDSR